MNNMIQGRKENGFTLIELVMVIVILGILAAFALPRFANLSSDARIATLDGAIGAVKSAAAIAHARWLANGDGATSIKLDGISVNMSNQGYPTQATGGIDVAAQIKDDFTLDATGGTNSTARITPNSANGTIACYFEYDETDGTVSNRTVTDC
jgi:prepilin-type N-terminal cleavage/methylation domain